MERLSSVISNGYAVNYTYYANGNRKDITYPNGAKEVYSYDKNNQVTLLENKKSDGSMLQSYSYTYDKSGNQLTKTENKGTTLYGYDGLNRLKSVTEPSGKRIAYTYDKACNRKTESTTIGNVTTLTTYTYNSQNRLVTTETTSPLGTERTAYLYDANGNMMSKTKSTITQRPSVGASLPSFELVIKGLAPDKDVAFYNYDNRNQLTHVAEGTNVSSYSYNTDGLRTEKKVNDVVTKYLYESDKVVAEADANNLIIARNYYGTSLLARQVENDVLFYMYNAHGDVTTLINGVGTVVATYDYDAFGTIIEKTGNANNSITYAGYQFDEKSDLYYLYARYYDSEIARFMSEDTYRGQKNDPLSLNLYSYVSNNPVRYLDPKEHKQVEGTTTSTNSTSNSKKKIANNTTSKTGNTNAAPKKPEAPAPVVAPKTVVTQQTKAETVKPQQTVLVPNPVTSIKIPFNMIDTSPKTPVNTFGMTTSGGSGNITISVTTNTSGQSGNSSGTNTSNVQSGTMVKDPVVAKSTTDVVSHSDEGMFSEKYTVISDKMGIYGVVEAATDNDSTVYLSWLENMKAQIKYSYKEVGRSTKATNKALQIIEDALPNIKFISRNSGAFTAIGTILDYIDSGAHVAIDFNENLSEGENISEYASDILGEGVIFAANSAIDAGSKVAGGFVGGLFGATISAPIGLPEVGGAIGEATGGFACVVLTNQQFGNFLDVGFDGHSGREIIKDTIQRILNFKIY